MAAIPATKKHATTITRIFIAELPPRAAGADAVGAG
jgi:hypothetical protein